MSEVLVYHDMLLRPHELGRVVTAAAGGAPPFGPTDDPVGWLVDLIDLAEGTEMAAELRRAGSLIFRTAEPERVGRLAEVAVRRPWLDAEDLLAALRRSDLRSARAVHRSVARAVAVAVRDGRIPVDAVSMWRTDRRLRAALLPAWLAFPHTLDDALLNDQLTDEPEEAALRVRGALALCADPEAAARHIAQHLGALSPATQDAVRAVLVGHGVAAPASEAPPPTLADLPWRGDDRGWYAIPEETALPVGERWLRRGPDRRQVDPVAVEPFRITDDEARRRYAEIARRAWREGLDAARSATAALPSLQAALTQLPSELDDLSETPPHRWFTGEGPSLPRADVEAAADELIARVGRALRSEPLLGALEKLTDALRAGAKEANAAMKEELRRRKEAGEPLPPGAVVPPDEP